MGCRVANQFLPLADDDKSRIEQATMQRLRSDNPCPERILPRRVRDTNDILVMQVTSVGSTVYDEPHSYVFARFKLLEILKGKVDDRLAKDKIGVTTTLGFYDPPIKNAALPLLTPGQKVLVFSDSSLYIDSPCEMMPASDSALSTVKQELKNFDAVHERSDLPWRIR